MRTQIQFVELALFSFVLPLPLTLVKIKCRTKWKPLFQFSNILMSCKSERISWFVVSYISITSFSLTATVFTTAQDSHATKKQSALLRRTSFTYLPLGCLVSQQLAFQFILQYLFTRSKWCNFVHLYWMKKLLIFKIFNQWFCSRWRNLNVYSNSSCCCCRLVKLLTAGCFAIGIALSFKFLS